MRFGQVRACASPWLVVSFSPSSSCDVIGIIRSSDHLPFPAGPAISPFDDRRPIPWLIDDSKGLEAGERGGDNNNNNNVTRRSLTRESHWAAPMIR